MCRAPPQASEDDVAGILTPFDECQHWKLLATGGLASNNAEVRRRAELYWQTLSPVADKLRSLQALPMADVVELLEHMQDVLDTLFRASFKEPRMLHFFRLLGGAARRSAASDIGGGGVIGGGRHRHDAALGRPRR